MYDVQLSIMVGSHYAVFGYICVGALAKVMALGSEVLAHGILDLENAAGDSAPGMPSLCKVLAPSYQSCSFPRDSPMSSLPGDG